LILNAPEWDALVPLPWDETNKLEDFLNRFKPKALLFARTDVWPVLSHLAQQKNIPTLLFSATFNSESSRFKWPGIIWTRWALQSLKNIFVVEASDLEALKKVYCSNNLPSSITVEGDTRYDQVLWRLQQNPLEASCLKFSGATVRKKFLMGSTWPEDLNVLLPPLCQKVLGSKVQSPELALTIAPHELKEIPHLVISLKDLGLDHQLWSELNREVWDPCKAWDPCKVLIIDKIGVLAPLYAHYDFAFVGGSFKKQVHSVMEPLAAGLFVFVGPHHINNREAVVFQNIFVKDHSCVKSVNNEAEFLESLNALLKLDIETLKHSSLQIKQEIQKRLGATQKTLEWIEQNVEL
jgi:3-deoxy-D-manno-octulosonic-acid transferase